MARFNFSLQKVLELRQYEEDQKAIELGNAQAELHRENLELKKIETMKNVFLEDNNNKNINLKNVRSGHDYLLQLNNKIEKQKIRITQAKTKVDEKRAILTKANQEKKSIELLKDKKRVEFKKAVNHEAIKKENEVALRSKNKLNDDISL